MFRVPGSLRNFPCVPRLNLDENFHRAFSLGVRETQGAEAIGARCFPKIGGFDPQFVVVKNNGKPEKPIKMDDLQIFWKHPGSVFLGREMGPRLFQANLGWRNIIPFGQIQCVNLNDSKFNMLQHGSLLFFWGGGGV